MKKLLILTAVSLITFAAFSQEKKARKVDYTIKSGLMFSRFLYENKSVQTTIKSNTGFYVSASAEMPLYKKLSVSPGVALVGKGNQAVLNNAYIEYTDLIYLEVPVNLMTKFDVGPGQIIVGAGPYLGVGLNGSIVKRYITDNNTIIPDDTKDINFSNTKGEFKNVDFGLNFLLGYRFKGGIGINGGYSLGLITAQETITTGQKIKNSGYSVGLSFIF